MFMRKIL
jgi:succinate dehydrogenase (ubiquinone) iron-sulfur subunit